MNSLADTQVLASNLFSKRLWELIYNLGISRTLLEISKNKWRTNTQEISTLPRTNFLAPLSLSHTHKSPLSPRIRVRSNFSSKIPHQNSRDEHTTKNEFLGHTYSRFFASSNSHTQLAFFSLSFRVSRTLPLSLGIGDFSLQFSGWVMRLLCLFIESPFLKLGNHQILIIRLH